MQLNKVSANGSNSKSKFKDHNYARFENILQNANFWDTFRYRPALRFVLR